MTRTVLTALRERYKKGKIVECISMDGEPRMTGQRGTVQFVDDAGQVHVAWNNGSSLALIPEADEFRIVGGCEND